MALPSPFLLLNAAVVRSLMSAEFDTETLFAPRVNLTEIEEGVNLAPKFDRDGLIPVITTDYASGEVLMHAYMNADALAKTIACGEAVYWSRSRQCLWHKGSTSGHVQTVMEMRVDCDQDTIWLRVRVAGGACCHVGYRSCFYRAVAVRKGQAESSPFGLTFEETEKVFDPATVYGGKGPSSS